MEMVLVIVILAIVAATAWPWVESVQANQRLRRAGDMVRAAWTQTRVQAMTEGAVYVFQFEFNSGNFRIQPLHSFDTDAAADLATEAAADGLTGSVVTSNRTLIEGVVFRVGRTEIDSRTTDIPSSDSGGAGQQGWSFPIYFYPDGTTSSASVAIGNERNLFVMLVLRGLTGVTTVSDLLTAEELP